ncbi:CmpA/NrtA family ABC transporter substrate-binding protein [Hyphomicrobium sp. D-2]|uniref:CmpA/NrtA family ABC transporter substrate-binding protein n=1 Tax=Hyphomicrobium sp. D-2 TaxID=3041621 RepID=UPI00245447E4|nr:CmpA/NrtA family ABC transporter substrate-binding protein [Hyphomicrobium sp. D-2]MDH4981685.1 CmpA/NrtA family ABC transporter substrate-binding protein [Hyphomicrobium sp. D-2]
MAEDTTERRVVDREVHAGFIPLVDCAPLVIASELGFDRQFGFTFHLHREVSWANIRDKLDVGVLDCAHMLAPMPIAATLGLGRATEPVIAPMSLSLNGNAITVSRALYTEMCARDVAAMGGDGMAAARAVAAVVRSRAGSGQEPLTLGMVYPFSCHNYDLRYWLASAGVDPDNDVNLVVIPPPLLSESLKAGRVDGFCVGQPWNSVSVAEGRGVIVATKNELWPMSPEKVLGVREAWADANGELLADIVRALTFACRWLDVPANRVAAAAILSRREYVNVSEDILLRPLTGRLDSGLAERPIVDEDAVVFHRDGANFPWRSHAVWIITQMIRWGQAREPFDIMALAERVYRPDIYRAAVDALGVTVPESDFKDEGKVASTSLPQASFFGGDEFDPAHALGYLKGVPIRAVTADIEAFAEYNP